jgi:hypothetical protein
MEQHLLSLLRCDECKSRSFITSTASSTRQRNSKTHLHIHFQQKLAQQGHLRDN